MIIRTRVFELSDHKYKNLCELARVMGISVSQIYRVREGKRHINQKFIIGAIKAYPEYNLDDLFYLASEEPMVSLKPNPPGQYLPSSLEERVSAIEKQRAPSYEV